MGRSRPAEYSAGKEGQAGLYDDPDTVLTDMLCDLRHYADRESIAFKTCLDRAEMHYAAEVKEDPAFRLARRPWRKPSLL